jgi:FkbM family methyltransferase
MAADGTGVPTAAFAVSHTLSGVPFADTARRLRHAPGVEAFDPLWRIVRPVYRRVLRVRSRFGGVPRRVNGELLRLRFPQSEVDSAYESRIFAALNGVLFPGAVFFDLGSSYGLYSLVAARAVGPSGRVVAFEPSATALERLRDHLTLNKVDDRVEAVQAVVSDESGSVAFFEQDGYGTLAREITATGEKYLRGTLSEGVVPATTLDEFCRERDVWPDVLKIDVDGAEGKVLRGATALLARQRGAIVLEMHPWAVRQLGDDEQKLLRWLNDAGWTHELIASDHNTNHYLCSPARMPSNRS